MSESKQRSARERIRASRRARQQRQKLLTRAAIAGGALLGVAAIVAVVLTTTGPRVGETVPIMPNAADHVPVGEEVEYSTNPPTSGPHYGESAPAGFYTEPVPDGYLVHSLEHGYVILWYNCDALTEEECNRLKDDVRRTVQGRAKLIGVPRSGMETPLALTSWGKLLRLEAFAAPQVNRFIRDNIGRAPEPQGP